LRSSISWSSWWKRRCSSRREAGLIALDGRTALVTGGSRGIGRATALLLARAGADVALTYHSRAAEAETVAGEIRQLGRRVHLSGGDLSDPAVAAAMADGVRRAFGRLDCFVANAGIWPPDEVPLGALGVERWRATMAANLDAAFLSTRAALGLMGPGGRIVLVSSTAGQRGEAFHGDYAATKGALIALTKSLAIECAPDILVNCVAPGWVDTDMCIPAFEGEGRERVRLSIPLRRIPPPEDIAGPILFLCSDLARHLTGAVVNVNGGSVL
jgi:3-oxoacyl-[acyl-carrier protein] reductase